MTANDQQSEKKKGPLFSIVIPTYNRAAFIAQTIDSVLRQSYGDFELIVVDDGSTDNTGDIVKAIHDPRLSYHPKANEERGAARNHGAELATGRYINFFDSDDLLYTDHLAAASESVQRFEEPEFFHLGYEIRDAAKNETLKVDNLPPTANDLLPLGNCFSCNGVFLRSDVAKKHPFNTDRELSGTEDYELWMRLASRYSLHCDNRITSVIVQHDERSELLADRAKLERRIELLEKYLLEDEEFLKRYKSKMPTFKANNRIYVALHLALTKQNRVGAIGYLARALSCSPDALKNRAFYGTLKRLVV